MALAEGDIVRINYTASIVETGEIIATTIREKAASIVDYDPSQRYSPKLVVVGSTIDIKGLDEHLEGTEVGSEFAFDIPNAFGTHDPDRIKTISFHKVGKDADQLDVGSPLEYDGKMGIVKLVSSGRLRVDFNHQHAGRTVRYDVKVIQRFDTMEEKLMALLDKSFGENLMYMVTAGTLTCRVPEELLHDPSLDRLKRIVKTDVFGNIPHINKLVFEEIYLRPGYRETEEEEPDSETMVCQDCGHEFTVPRRPEEDEDDEYDESEEEDDEYDREEYTEEEGEQKGRTFGQVFRDWVARLARWKKSPRSQV